MIQSKLCTQLIHINSLMVVNILSSFQNDLNLLKITCIQQILQLLRHIPIFLNFKETVTYQ